MKRFVLCGLILVFAACKSKDEKTNAIPQPQVPLAQSANPEVFNTAFNQLLSDYYALKDNFIDEKDSGIAQSARSLIHASDSLPVEALKADSNIVATARTFAESIRSELKGLLGEKDMEGKRKSFQMVSDQLYDLVRTVKYDRAIVYHDYCPMAFNDQGANWLSNTTSIRNPYIPKKMITCGEVKDSIDFRQKK